MGAFETGPPLVRPRRGSPVLEGHVKAHGDLSWPVGCQGMAGGGAMGWGE